MYFSNKKVVYIAIKPQAGKQGKACRKGRKKKLNTKPLDPTLIESRVMAADWGSIVKTNKH